MALTAVGRGPPAALRRLPRAARARCRRAARGRVDRRARRDPGAARLPARARCCAGSAWATPTACCSRRLVAVSGAWTLATLAVVVFAALATFADAGRGLALYLLVAPLVPVLGVVAGVRRRPTPSSSSRARPRTRRRGSRRCAPRPSWSRLVPLSIARRPRRAEHRLARVRVAAASARAHPRHARRDDLVGARARGHRRRRGVGRRDRGRVREPRRRRGRQPRAAGRLPRPRGARGRRAGASHRSRTHPRRLA